MLDLGEFERDLARFRVDVPKMSDDDLLALDFEFAVARHEAELENDFEVVTMQDVFISVIVGELSLRGYKLGKLNF